MRIILAGVDTYDIQLQMAGGAGLGWAGLAFSGNFPVKIPAMLTTATTATIVTTTHLTTADM